MEKQRVKILLINVPIWNRLNILENVWIKTNRQTKRNKKRKERKEKKSTLLLEFNLILRQGDLQTYVYIYADVI